MVHSSNSSDTQIHMNNNQDGAEGHPNNVKQVEEPMYTQDPGLLARLEHFTWVSRLHPQPSCLAYFYHFEQARRTTFHRRGLFNLQL